MDKRQLDERVSRTVMDSVFTEKENYNKGSNLDIYKVNHTICPEYVDLMEIR